MVQLDKNSYHKTIESLKNVTINNLFARSVIEKKVDGKVYVDNTENPKTFYVVHPYHMSLLFGNHRNTEFNKSFLDYSLNSDKLRNNEEWLQANPGDWDKVLFELYGKNLVKPEQKHETKQNGNIELNTRINFKFNKDKYLAGKSVKMPSLCEIVRTNSSMFKEMTGTVIPSYFWNSAEDFEKNGVGYSLLSDNQLATTAYSAFIHDEMLEIGIETIPEFRGNGFAQLACSALIDYSLENNYEPVWACRLSNIASYKLAHKLGFEVNIELPYYRLGV